MKVAVFIDHDIICRHFVLSGALSSLTQSADVHFVFPGGDSKRVTLDPQTLPLDAPWSTLPIDSARQQTWNWMLFADQLKLRPGAHEVAIRRFRWRALGWKAAVLLTLAGLPLGSSIFRSIIRQRLAQHPASALRSFFDREQPDIVLHPTVLAGVFINDLAEECRKRGIPMVAAMNSWDNPSTKRAVVGWPDHLLVWGAQTRRHATRFMGIPEEQVTEFGAAQFDVFRDPPRRDRQAFCEAHGLDPSRRIILFAGSNAHTDEAATLEALDTAITEGKLDRVSIIYRPHPWGNGGKGGSRLATARWENVVVDQTMRAYLDRIAAGHRGITLPDYRDTHDLLSVVDGVVSPLSTILIEGALHGKPVVGYIPEDHAVSEKAASVPYLHFEEFFALEDVICAWSLDDMIEGIRQIANALEGPARGARLRDASAQFVKPFQAPWRDRIVAFLRDATSIKAKAAV